MREILSKEKFISHIEGMKLEHDKLNELYSEFGIDTIEMSWCYSSNHFLELLENVMNDEHGDISWWCYETDFGRDKSVDKIYTSSGEELELIVKLETSGDLYDFLVRED